MEYKEELGKEFENYLLEKGCTVADEKAFVEGGFERILKTPSGRPFYVERGSLTLVGEVPDAGLKVKSFRDKASVRSSGSVFIEGGTYKNLQEYEDSFKEMKTGLEEMNRFIETYQASK